MVTFAQIQIEYNFLYECFLMSLQWLFGYPQFFYEKNQLEKSSSFECERRK